jgi:general secretion pathway protein M
MITSLSPRSRRLVAVGLLLAVLLAGYSFVVAPVLASYGEKREEAAQLEATLGKYEEIGREIPELQKQLEALHQQGATGAGYLEGQNETLITAALQERLKDVVAQTGGRLNSTQVLANTEHTTTHRVAVRGHMQMNLVALQHVLYTLESGTPYLFIDNLDIQPMIGARAQQTPDTDALLDVHLDVYGYMRGGA